MALVLNNRGELAEDQGRFEAAEALYLLAILVGDRVGDLDMVLAGLENLAGLLRAVGRQQEEKALNR